MRLAHDTADVQKDATDSWDIFGISIWEAGCTGLDVVTLWC